MVRIISLAITTTSNTYPRCYLWATFSTWWRSSFWGSTSVGH